MLAAQILSLYTLDPISLQIQLEFFGYYLFFSKKVLDDDISHGIPKCITLHIQSMHLVFPSYPILLASSSSYIVEKTLRKPWLQIIMVQIAITLKI
jgi:hypothetical protein